MANNGPRIRSLLRQAKRNVESGKQAAAESLYRQILAEDPDQIEAWIGLAALAIDPDEQKEAYEKALTLDGTNHQALVGLGLVDGTSSEPDPNETVLTSDSENAETDLAVAIEETEIGSGGSNLAPPTTEKGDIDHAHGDSSSDSHDHEHNYNKEELQNDSVVTVDEYDLVCYRHPDRTTSLRCNNCGRPICSSCAVKTPVGYRCPVCIREAEDAFFNTRPTDYLIAPAVSFFLSIIIGWLVVRFGSGFSFLFMILFFFAGGFVGGVIGRVTKRAIGNRRGRYIPTLVAAMVIIGVVIPALPILLALIFGQLAAFTALIAPGIYLFTATPSAYFWSR